MEGALNGIKLDGLDKAIISALSKNGRQPYREIGRDLGISEATVRQRVSRLTDSGLIHIAAVGNFIALGFDVVAHILLKVTPAHVDEYARRLSEFPSVRFVTITFGEASGGSVNTVATNPGVTFVPDAAIRSAVGSPVTGTATDSASKFF